MAHTYEVAAFEADESSMRTAFYVALQCRTCGAAKVEQTETVGEPFYGGWPGEADAD